MATDKKYRLIFFDIRGRGEIPRMIFAFKGVEYEDVRLSSKDDWETKKTEFPFDQLPVLEVDGVAVAQSLAISRYLAREFGLTGANNWEAAICDMAIESFQDIFRGIKKYMTEKDKIKKQSMHKRFFTEIIPTVLERVEKIAKQSTGKYLVGDEITWADIGLGFLLGEFLNHEPTILDKYPRLKELNTNVNNQPSIKHWLETRPPPSTFDQLFFPNNVVEF